MTEEFKHSFKTKAIAIIMIFGIFGMMMACFVGFGGR